MCEVSTEINGLSTSMINAAADECDIVLFLLPVADFVVKQVLTTYALFVSDVIAVMLRT